MRRTCVFGLVLGGMVLFTGCASNNTGIIEGTAWRSLAVFDEDGEEIPAGAVRLEFTKGGTVFLRGVQGQYEGKYSLGAGDWVSLHLEQELGGRKDHRQKIIIKGDRLTMIDQDGSVVKFEEDP